MVLSQVFETEIGGKTLTIETGGLAEQANGAVIVRYGDTLVLVTACIRSQPREGIDFLPLTIDFEERLYAAGKIPGGFFRREGRPTQDAVLAGRLADRPLRPLFPKGFYNDVQVVITVLSTDRENDPDILGIIGASAALTISEIPFYRPVSAVRVGQLQDGLVLNPGFSQLQESRLDLVVAGTEEAVVMVEAGARELSEELIFQAIKFGQEANQLIIGLQKQLRQAWGKPKMEALAKPANPELETALSSILGDRLAQAILNTAQKAGREEALERLRKEALDRLGESFPAADILSAFEAKVKAEMRTSILEKGLRPDGRGFTEIRPISSEVGILPRTHGSGLFARGQTQVLTITTLGSVGDVQPLDGISPEESKRFMHHYNFPPFATGEVKRMGSPGRREIGHGALVERALAPVLPSEEEFPYTLRLVSEVLSSNGSTSMASVCGSSLSLMDAGVPIKAPVAGIAMGLVTAEDGRYAVLTDIAGLEDAYGDMDFKVAGTSAGITALQMDIKLKGVSYEIIEKALSQAYEARLAILEKMLQTIASSRPELSLYAPRLYRIKIDPEKIGAVIGPGGRTIRSIIDETKATVDVENDGTVIVGSASEEAAQRAIARIESLTKEVTVGEIYTGKVTRLLNFGAMVEILPGKEGLVPLTELADHQVSRVEDVVKVGDEITVKVVEIDRLGRINLSRRAVFEGPSQAGGARVRDSGAPSRPPMRPRPQPSHRPTSPGGGEPRRGYDRDPGPGRGPSRSTFGKR